MDSDKGVNGSILFDFWTDFESPLDGTKDTTSDFFTIVESNRYVESTVSNDVALAGGDKSRSGMMAIGTAEEEPVVAAADAEPVVDDVVSEQVEGEAPVQEIEPATEVLLEVTESAPIAEEVAPVEESVSVMEESASVEELAPAA